MAPVGDVFLYPENAKVYMWVHVPSSIHSEASLAHATILASSRWSAEQVQKTWGVQAVPLTLFSNARRVPEKSCGGVLFFGRLTRAKGAFVAARLAGELRGATKVTIAGATWSTPPGDLETLTTICKIHGVTLVKDPSNDQVKELYGSNQMFWQLAGLEKGPPEAFGLAAADAMLSGLTVLGAPLGAVPEWLPPRFYASSLQEVTPLTLKALRGELQGATSEELDWVSQVAFESSLIRAGIHW
jgi:hypothetical protein